MIRKKHNHKTSNNQQHSEEESQKIYSSKQLKVRKKKKIRNPYNQAPHLTQDTTWEGNLNTIKNYTQEPRGQPFPNRWPQGYSEQKKTR